MVFLEISGIPWDGNHAQRHRENGLLACGWEVILSDLRHSCNLCYSSAGSQAARTIEANRKFVLYKKMLRKNKVYTTKKKESDKVPLLLFERGMKLPYQHDPSSAKRSKWT